MKFLESEIIGSDDITWNGLLEEMRDKKLIGNSNTQWIFRAIGKWVGDKPPILSSFDEAWERSTVQRPPKDRTRYATWMLSEFKRDAYRYSSNLPKRGDFLEWFALARHYGMPCQLVDFSYSFYVTTYFALSNRGIDRSKNGNPQEDGCIIAINLTRMKEDVESKLKSNKKWKQHKVPYKKASFHDPKLFHWFAFKSKLDYVVPVSPLRRNPRQANQRGLFLCPGNSKKSFEQNLEKTLPGDENFKRLIFLPSSLRTKALLDLREMNISMATIYPDLSGWAQSQRDLVHLEINEERLQWEIDRALKDPII